jgi:hypothetical protein
MFRVLVDTCVWLDLAKDHRQQSLLHVLEELVRKREVALIVPRTGCEEFTRNKARVVEESTRSLSGVLKRVKDVVDRFGDTRRKRVVLEQLNDVDHRLPILGESAIESIARIEKLLATSPIIETTDAVKLRAAQRAIDRRAPFHRQRNGIDDAVLIETYADCLTERAPRTRFAFVTHNTKDFSHPTANDKLPHPDIAPCFSRIRSLYFVSLGASPGEKHYIELLQKFAHIFGLHFVPERSAYCRFNEHGDIEDVVSIVRVDDNSGRYRGGWIVTVDRAVLDEYMALTDTTIVRMFDIARFKPKQFGGWSHR